MAVQDQTFLLSCIEHSSNGRIDFDAVAKDLGLPTRGAAYMRYNRIKAKYAKLNDSAEHPATQKPKQATKTASDRDSRAGGKKRKLNEDDKAAVKAEPEQQDASDLL